MKKILILFYLLFVLCVVLQAQKINIKLPQAANKEYAFILNKGIKQDTIQTGKLSFVGEAVIHIPEKYKDYAGMGALLFKDAPAVNMIVNKESFVVEQGDNSQQYTFKNSLENNYLYDIIQGKTSQHSTDTMMYAPHFVEFMRYMMQLNRINQQGAANLAEKSNLRLYARDYLDMDRLYTSGIWYNIVDGITKLNQDQEMMGKDMVGILKRIKSEEVFEHFANNLILITDQYGWDDALYIIAGYIQESGRIAVPTGNIFLAYSLTKIKKGAQVPPIEGLTRSLDMQDGSKTLIVFYQPDCENCKVQIEQLLKYYPILEQKGIRVVSISADHNKDSFDADVKHFPWDDKLCDFNGFAGKNFINYGIMGTPTFFLLDERGNLLKRYAKISDILSDIDVFQ